MKTDLTFIQTDRAPAAIGPYSQAIESGGWVFVSGQLGMDPTTGELVADDFASQSRQALENIRSVLAAAGMGLDHVLAVDVFLTDLAQFQSFNDIYGTFFGAHKPARAVVEVSALPKGARIEVKCFARKT